MILFDVLEGVDSSQDVAVLISTSDLHLNAPRPVQVPPVPGLQQRIGELGKGHALSLLHSTSHAITRLANGHISSPGRPKPAVAGGWLHSRFLSQHRAYSGSGPEDLQKFEDGELVEPLVIVDESSLPGPLPHVPVRTSV